MVKNCVIADKNDEACVKFCAFVADVNTLLIVDEIRVVFDDVKPSLTEALEILLLLTVVIDSVLPLLAKLLALNVVEASLLIVVNNLLTLTDGADDVVLTLDAFGDILLFLATVTVNVLLWFVTVITVVSNAILLLALVDVL